MINFTAIPCKFVELVTYPTPNFFRCITKPDFEILARMDTDINEASIPIFNRMSAMYTVHELC